MGYFTYRIFKNVSLARLKRKVEANLALYDRGTAGRRIALHLMQGRGCTAMVMDYLAGRPELLHTIGKQLGVVWMDVRYQDGDAWDLSIYDGDNHRCTHEVNPWAFEERYLYDQKLIDFRINRICECWPAKAARIRPYLLLWGKPVIRSGRRRIVRRKGKAHPEDRHEYGDADQIYDFVRCFGLGENSRTVFVGYSGKQA